MKYTKPNYRLLAIDDKALVSNPYPAFTHSLPLLSPILPLMPHSYSLQRVSINLRLAISY